jgi:SNF2 family DNA or RNA helicase
METGTGKTYVAINRFAAMFEAGLATQLLVIAPNGVHADWLRDQFPKHWPGPEYRAAYYLSGAPQKHRRTIDALFDHNVSNDPPVFYGPRILTVNIEAIRSRSTYDLVLRFLRQGKTLFVIDESTMIKTPGSKQRKCMQALGARAAFRVIMTGSDVTESPMDLYAQFQFLREGALGCPNFITFKARYAEWEGAGEPQELPNGQIIYKYYVIKTYKHMDELRERVNAMSFRVLKKDCLDLPDKVYIQRSVMLEGDQRAAYNSARDNALSAFAAGELTIEHALTRILRLAQIAGGFLPLDSEDEAVPFAVNAKMKALLNEIEDIPAKAQVIVWARFKPELRAITQQLTKHYGRVARYWGDIHIRDRDDEAAQFKAGQRRFMVAQQRAGGKGHNWVAGTYVIYYSNSFSYEDRFQSEDRSHRIGQKEKVTYIDLSAAGTVDVKILAALKAKKDVADYFKSTTPGEFLQ